MVIHVLHRGALESKFSSKIIKYIVNLRFRDWYFVVVAPCGVLGGIDIHCRSWWDNSDRIKKKKKTKKKITIPLAYKFNLSRSGN